MNPSRLLIVFLVCFSLSGLAMDPENEIAPLLQEFSQPGNPGMALAVVQDGRIIFSKTCGLADVEGRVPCATNTSFRLASLTKQFTAMSILMLTDKGRLSLDDRLSKFFPNFPEYGKAISLRHLLTHSSGLMDYEDNIPAGTVVPVKDRDVLAIEMNQRGTYFPPGSSFKYSNSGYALLALVVETASGEPFPTYLQKHLFGPLGMSHSIAFVAGGPAIPNRAFGYVKTRDHFEFSDQSLTSSVLGDGGVYSSITDLARWDRALSGESLVSRKWLHEMLTAHSVTTDFPGSGYGYGWYVKQARGTDCVWHYGSTCGFSTRIERYPQKGLTIIILANRRNADLEPLSKKLTDSFWKAP